MSVTLLPANPNELLRSMRRAVYINPADLLDNPRNLRTNLDDLDDLKASIEVLGVLCPLVVIPVDLDDPDTAYMIIIGHRRKYAAIALGLDEVPCWIAETEDEAVKVAAQLAENGHRVGLSVTEEAEGFHQLTLLNWSMEKISEVRHIPVAEVKKTLRLRELPEQARQAADSGQITLDDAARMAEFADEPAALARILKATSTWGIQHAISSERSKKQYADAKERLKAQLVLDGVKVTSRPKGFPAGVEKPAKALVDAAGVAVDPEVAKTLPGFAAFIDKEGVEGAQAVIYCTDPDKYGYTVATPSYGASAAVSVEEQARRAAEAEAKARYLEDLAVAAPVRHEFYRTAYGSAKAAKRLFVDALRSAVTGEELPLYDSWDDLYTALGGTDGDVVATAGEDRLRRCLVALWICGHEQNLAWVTVQQPWNMSRTAAAWWLDRLVADGYTLSDAEARLHREMRGEDDPAGGQQVTAQENPTPDADGADVGQEADGDLPDVPDDVDGMDAALQELTDLDPATV